MKISVNKDGQNVTIDMMPMRGRDCKKGWELLAATQKASDDSLQADAFTAYKNWRDETAARLAGISVDDLDDLTAEDKSKFTSVVDKATKDDLGFTLS